MTEALIFSGIVVLVALLGFALGHYITLRSVAHVQPSAIEIERLRTSQSVEPDPWADTEEAGRLDIDKTIEEVAEERFAETGLPRDKFDPKAFFGYGQGEMRVVSGGSSPMAGSTAGVEKGGGDDN